MAVWMMQVDRESHCVKINDRRWRLSLDFNSRGGILRSRAVTIFVTLSGFLEAGQCLASIDQRRGLRIQNDGIVDGPQIF